MRPAVGFLWCGYGDSNPNAKAREPKGDVTSVKYLGANVKGKINRSAALDNYPGVMLSKRR